MRPSLRLLAVLLPLALLSGCASLRDLVRSAIEEPTLRFQGADVRELSLTGALLDLEFVVDNPNPVGLTLAAVDYSLEVNERPFTSGSPEAGLSLAPEGSSVLRFPARVTFSELGTTLLEVLQTGVVRYQASGSLGVETPLGIVRLPLSAGGELDLPELPGIALEAPRIESLSLSTATLTVPIRLSNPNDFPLPIAGISAAVRIAGSPVGETRLDTARVLAAGETVALELPVRFRLGQAADAALALSRGEGRIEVDGSLTSGAESLPFRLEEVLRLLRN